MIPEQPYSVLPGLLCHCSSCDADSDRAGSEKGFAQRGGD